MIRHVVDDLYQIGAEVAGGYGREAVNVYVLLNDDSPILVDCGSHLHRETIMAGLDALLDGRRPGHIFLTHSELPHAGNIAAVFKRWPDIQVLVSHVMLPYIEVLPVLPLAQMTQIVAGTRLDIGDRTLTFLDAMLKDQPGSQWIYDSRTRALFTGDGFGYYHDSADSGKFSDEVDGGVRADQFRAYHFTAFRFLRWISPTRFNADLDRLFQNRPVEIIAPVHGGAIRGDVAVHVERLKDALAAISRQYRSKSHAPIA